MSRPERDADMILGMEPIIEYEMTTQQAKAWKVCCHWCKLTGEIFPGQSHATVPKRGDPRNGHLFRHAWKMLRDTAGYGLAEKDVPLYVRAQLEMIRAIKIDDSGTHARIDPAVLTGEKAWVRWKVWKRKYDRANEQRRHSGTDTATPTHRIAQELESSRRFLESCFGETTAANLREAVADGRVREWVTQRRLSPYYCLLSPWLRAALAGGKMQDHFPQVDLAIYKKDLDRAALDAMVERFPHEFRPSGGCP